MCITIKFGVEQMDAKRDFIGQRQLPLSLMEEDVFETGVLRDVYLIYTVAQNKKKHEMKKFN